MAFSVLITGGAGYIGSHTAFLLAQLDYRIIILDTFVHNQFFSPSWATVIKGDIENTQLLTKIFEKNSIDAVMHFAAYIEGGKSVKNPAKFYNNNVTKTLNILNVMQANNVNKLIFSSSCAVYGIPKSLPIVEKHPKNPISPYGKTKLMVEMILEDFIKAYNLNYVSLRYFNATGALPEEGLGEQHVPETHVIPLLLACAYEKKIFNVFGTDYPTPDKTAIRDYIHVKDIAQAHVLALRYLENDNPSDSFNLGTEKGISVKEMVHAVETACKTTLRIHWAERRVGDPPVLVADASKAKKKLGWKPKYSSITNIVQSAYDFYLLQQKKLLSQNIQRQAHK